MARFTIPVRSKPSYESRDNLLEQMGSISPQWTQWRQMVADATNTGPGTGRKLKMIGGSSTLGSNQIRGIRSGVVRKPGLYDQEADIALHNYLTRQGVSRNDPQVQSFMKQQGSSRQAFEALMRALKNG